MFRLKPKYRIKVYTFPDSTKKFTVEKRIYLFFYVGEHAEDFKNLRDAQNHIEWLKSQYINYVY